MKTIVSLIQHPSFKNLENCYHNFHVKHKHRQKSEATLIQNVLSKLTTKKEGAVTRDTYYKSVHHRYNQRSQLTKRSNKKQYCMQAIHLNTRNTI